MMQSELAKQQAEMSGHTKLTAVTLYYNGKRTQHFLMLRHNDKGEAILPVAALDKILSERGVRRGDTYSVA